MRLSSLFLLAAVLLLVPLNVYGQQILPNPNPAGNSITIDTGGWYNALNPYDNGGTINVNNNTQLTNYYLLNNYGTLTNGGTLTNDSGSALTNYYLLNNYGTLYNGGTLTNYDTLNINSGGWLRNDGLLLNDGTIDNTNGTFVNNGTYSGSGTILGSWTDNGIVKPGNSAGVLTTDGDYYKRAGSKEIELGGLFHGGGDQSLTEFDWLDVTGNVELAGTLDVYLIDSFELLAGMSFKILHVGGVLSGQYDGLDEGSLVGNYSGTDLYITYAGGDGNDVTLFSPAVPEPAAILLALLGLALLPRRREGCNIPAGITPL
jgi:hypothetical protein